MEVNFILSLVMITIVALVIKFLPGRIRGKEPKAPAKHDYKIY
jgi:hypothetical protein